MSSFVGEMRRRVTIESQSAVADGQGGSTMTWGTFASGWAHLDPKTGVERLFAGKLEGDTYMRITMRWRQGVTTAMRVKYVTSFQTRYFQIHVILNKEEQWDFMTLLCMEGVGS